MAHKITQRDTVYLAEIPELFNGKGWHGKGTVNNDFSPERLGNVLFGHRILPTMVDNGQSPVATGEFVAVANDDNLPVGGTVGNRFNTPQNGELFELFRDALTGSDYKIV